MIGSAVARRKSVEKANVKLKGSGCSSLPGQNIFKNNICYLALLLTKEEMQVQNVTCSQFAILNSKAILDFTSG
jgi:hypothetical protein